MESKTIVKWGPIRDWELSEQLVEAEKLLKMIQEREVQDKEVQDKELQENVKKYFEKYK